MALKAPRPLRGQCVKAAVKKKERFEGVGRLGEYGPEGVKATERPMCKGGAPLVVGLSFVIVFWYQLEK